MDFLYLKYALIAWLLFLLLDPILTLVINIWAQEHPISAISQKFPLWAYLIVAARILAACFGVFYAFVFIWGY